MKLSKTLLLSFATLVAAGTSAGAATIETYAIDPVHSSVKFSIRHFVAKTTGNFGEFSGTITVNREDLTKNFVEAQIKIPSIDTDNTKRDEHLQEGEYFDSVSFPMITFTSTEWAAAEREDLFKVAGILSIRGIEKEVVLNAELLGFGPGANDTFLSGWEITTDIDRTEWGIQGGRPSVGDEVSITINIEAIRQ